MWELSGNHFFYDYSNPGRKANCRLEHKEPNFDAHFTRLQEAPVCRGAAFVWIWGAQIPRGTLFSFSQCMESAPVLHGRPSPASEPRQSAHMFTTLHHHFFFFQIK